MMIYKLVNSTKWRTYHPFIPKYLFLHWQQHVNIILYIRDLMQRTPSSSRSKKFQRFSRLKQISSLIGKFILIKMYNTYKEMIKGMAILTKLEKCSSHTKNIFLVVLAPCWREKENLLWICMNFVQMILLVQIT